MIPDRPAYQKNQPLPDHFASARGPEFVGRSTRGKEGTIAKTTLAPLTPDKMLTALNTA